MASGAGFRAGVIEAGAVFERGLVRLKEREKYGWPTPFVRYTPDQRCRPLNLFPWAHSIIALAYPWYFPSPPPLPGQGVVAMSARGDDYHRVLKRLVEPLVSYLVEKGAQKVVVHIDNGPLLEREAAFLAGLGYYGYNCCLIVPGWGSRVALGLIITDLEIEPTVNLEAAVNQGEKKCRGCGRCLAACPTGALREPYVLNPDLCLSYWTQKRGFIPPENRVLMGQRLFGCDTCQDVCPENHRSFPGETGSSVRALWDLIYILEMDDRGFEEQFGNTAVGWRGRTVLQRNALIALGNSGHVSDRAGRALERCLSSPSPVIREHAVWAHNRLLSK